MSSRSVIIGLVACEPSGDILGAGLMRALRNHLSEVQFVGVAGPCMQSENMTTWYNMEELSVMGITEVVKRLPRILRIRRDLIYRFTSLHPDVFVGIDSPDFMITLEKKLKKHGIRTIHYVSPSVWAWRKNRLFKIGRATDKVLAILPFEKAYYDRHNIICQFIGHTLADTIPLDPDKSAARAALNIPSKVRCLAILPGSRHNEIAMLSAIFLHTAEILYQHFTNIEIVVPLVNIACRNQFTQIKSIVAPLLPLRILDNNSIQAMIAADAALIASGTASLECMLAKCPMVIGYRMNRLTFVLAQWLVKTPWISLPNLLAGRAIVKEMLQEACQPSYLAEALIPLFDNNHKKVIALLSTFRQLHKKIRCNADEQAAKAVISLINN